VCYLGHLVALSSTGAPLCELKLIFDLAHEFEDESAFDIVAVMNVTGQ
jgi:hypothetical protein